MHLNPEFNLNIENANAGINLIFQICKRENKSFKQWFNKAKTGKVSLDDAKAFYAASKLIADDDFLSQWMKETDSQLKRTNRTIKNVKNAVLTVDHVNKNIQMEITSY
jgi:hypothetical protein